jgi:hypothetical protein
MSENPIPHKEYSASSLAKELGLNSKEVFQKLVDLKFIVKNGENWELTHIGKNKGGQYKESPYGKYIAWPEAIIGELKGS